MKKHAIVFLAFLLLCGAFMGCESKNGRDSTYILAKIKETQKEFPMGAIYRSSAEEGDAEYISETGLATLYGAKHISVCFPLLRDWALYISSFEMPCEIAVFSCYSRSDTDTVAKMCFARADIIKAYISHIEEYSQISAEVWVKADRVAMYVGASPNEAERAFMRSAD